MSHSVHRHLQVAAAEYDEAIRRFIPGYEAMIDKAASAVATIHPDRVLDLGAGTGALSARFLAKPGEGVVELWDVDPEMLAVARGRLVGAGDRAVFEEQSFIDPFPPCDAIMASLSLHHIADFDEKVKLMVRAFEALRPGGRFVNADVTIPDDEPDRQARYQAWADHQIEMGIEEGQAWANFETWSKEDTYFPLEAELEALEEAGFLARCVWRRGPSTVLVGEVPLA